ncbi:MAG: metallophosphoesterase [Candidatus Nanohaloarchaea archaeon]
MRVILLTDIHGDTEKLGKILEQEEYDAVLCAGDLSDANKFDDYEGKLLEVIEEFEKEGKMTKAVPGNMDPEEECVRNLIQKRMNIHKKIASFEDFEAVGFGGGKTPFGTPFEPEGEEIRNALSTLYDRMKNETRVAVIHQPPKNCLDEVDGNHVGSEEVKELIEEKDFELVLTGHIHEARGREQLGGATVVNPGPVLEGFYAVADLHDGLELEMKQL